MRISSELQASRKLMGIPWSHSRRRDIRVPQSDLYIRRFDGEWQGPDFRGPGMYLTDNVA